MFLLPFFLLHHDSRKSVILHFCNASKYTHDFLLAIYSHRIQFVNRLFKFKSLGSRHLRLEAGLLDQVVEGTLLLEELGGCVKLDHLALVQDDNAVAV